MVVSQDGSQMSFIGVECMYMDDCIISVMSLIGMDGMEMRDGRLAFMDPCGQCGSGEWPR